MPDDDEEDDEDDIDDEKWKKLQPFLQRATLFAKVLKEQMDSAKHLHLAPPSPTRATTRKRARQDASGSERVKRLRKDDDSDVISDREDKSGQPEEPLPRFMQPALITGAKLKEYQLEGVAWMVGLYQNGISGILGAW